MSREMPSAKLFHIDFQVGWPVRHRGRCPHAMSPQTHCGFQALIYARPAVSVLSAWRLGPLTRLTLPSYDEVRSVVARANFFTLSLSQSANFYRMQIIRMLKFMLLLLSLIRDKKWLEKYVNTLFYSHKSYAILFIWK